MFAMSVLSLFSVFCVFACLLLIQGWRVCMVLLCQVLCSALSCLFFSLWGWTLILSSLVPFVVLNVVYSSIVMCVVKIAQLSLPKIHLGCYCFGLSLFDTTDTVKWRTCGNVRNLLFSCSFDDDSYRVVSECLSVCMKRSLTSFRLSECPEIREHSMRISCHCFSMFISLSLTLIKGSNERKKKRIYFVKKTDLSDSFFSSPFLPLFC